MGDSAIFIICVGGIFHYTQSSLYHTTKLRYNIIMIGHIVVLYIYMYEGQRNTYDTRIYSVRFVLIFDVEATSCVSKMIIEYGPFSK